MPQYLTIGYGDSAGYDRTPPHLRDAAHAHDKSLAAMGSVMGRAGTPVQVRNPEASGIQTLNAPYMRSDLPVAGFALITAESLEDAVRQVAQSPCAIAHGVVEVWPLLSESTSLPSI